MACISSPVWQGSQAFPKWKPVSSKELGISVRLSLAAFLVAIRNHTTGLGGTVLQESASLQHIFLYLQYILFLYLQYIFLYLNTSQQLTYSPKMHVPMFIHQVCFHLLFLFFLLTFYFPQHITRGMKNAFTGRETRSNFLCLTCGRV